MDNLLTTKQVCDILKVHRITLLRMRKRGLLQAIRLSQNTTRYERGEVERLLKDQKEKRK